MIRQPSSTQLRQINRSEGQILLQPDPNYTFRLVKCQAHGGEPATRIG